MDNTSHKFRFSSHLRLLRDQRAARIGKPDADFLARIAAETISDRLEVVNRSFNNCSDVMSRFDAMQDRLEASICNGLVRRIGGFSQTGCAENWDPLTETLPLQPQSQDLITSIFGLHRVGNLASVLQQIRLALKPDGLFMAAVPGSQTLQELRQSFIEAETEITGGAAMRVDPFGTLQQYGSLLQQCGFALPVADSEISVVRYSSLRPLIGDLRSMGSTLNVEGPVSLLNRKLYERAEQIYFEKFSDDDKRIRVTFECVYLSAWAPDSSQQKPLKPGSAKTPLSHALSTSNRS